MMKSDILIAGNGPSRLNFNLNDLKFKTGWPLYSCNLSHKNVTPGGLDSDLVFAVDSHIKNEIVSKCKTATLDESFTFEPVEMWEELYGQTNRPYNNSGCIAIQWALNQEFKNIHLFGFDCFLINGYSDNIFIGNKHYKNMISQNENYGRINYMNWIIQKYKDVNFNVYYPYGSSFIKLERENLVYKNEIYI